MTSSPPNVVCHLTVGLVLRRTVRRALMENPSITFTEDKGFLDSLFVISAPQAVVDEIEKWTKKVNAGAN